MNVKIPDWVHDAFGRAYKQCSFIRSDILVVDQNTIVLLVKLLEEDYETGCDFINEVVIVASKTASNNAPAFREVVRNVHIGEVRLSRSRKSVVVDILVDTDGFISTHPKRILLSKVF